MKVEMRPGETKSKYPYLARFSNGEVVLLTACRTGTSLSEDRLGQFREDWAEQFVEPYTGIVILKND